jgi:hypothetical protein
MNESSDERAELSPHPSRWELLVWMLDQGLRRREKSPLCGDTAERAGATRPRHEYDDLIVRQ